MLRLDGSRGMVPLSVLILLSWFGSAPVAAHADYVSLYAGVSRSSGSTCIDISTTTAASCGYGSAAGSLAAGTLGTSAVIGPGQLPLPDSPSDTYLESVTSGSLSYDFTSSVPVGSLLFSVGLSGTTYVSSTNPNASSGLPDTCAPFACYADLLFNVGSNATLIGEPGYLSVTQDGNGLQSNAFALAISVPISNGQSVLSLGLQTIAMCPSLSAAAITNGASCEAGADYLDPLTITSASVYDANGDLVPDATLISQSGYVPPAAATPEPSTFALLGSGMALILFLCRRSSRANGLEAVGRRYRSSRRL